MSTAERRTMTAEEYLALDRASDERLMYFAGEVFAMTGASRRHNLIALNIARRLMEQLDDRPCEVYSNDMRVHVREAGFYTYPDVVVACPPIEMADEHDDMLLNPRVLIEVLSPSTADYDRGTKFNHYRQLASLDTYLLVEQERMAIERRSRRAEGGWLMDLFEGSDAEVTIPAIQCALRATEVYAKVAFDDRTA